MQNQLLQQFVHSPHSYLLLVLLYSVVFVLFLIPGMILASLLVRGKYIKENFTLLCAFAISCFIGYMFFWIYFFNNNLGKKFSRLFLCCSLFCFLSSYIRKSILKTLSSIDCKIPILLTYFIGLYYISTINLGFTSGKDAITHIDFLMDRLGAVVGSPDYLIQHTMTYKLYYGQTIWNYIMAPQSGSTLADRPPLLAGITLIYYNLIPSLLRFYYFMAITTIASLIWVPSVWSLCRVSKLSPVRSIILTLVISQTGFFFFFSVFTTPKLLSGSLAVGAFILLVQQPYLNKTIANKIEVIIAAVLAAMGCLSHLSIGIMLIAIAFILLTPKLFPQMASVLIGTVLFVALASPYILLKSVNEPDASKLLKVTIGNRSSEIDPNESAITAAIKSYSHLSLKHIAGKKIDNIRSLFFNLEHPFEPYKSIFIAKAEDTRNVFRRIDVWEVIRTIGVFNLAWLFFLPLPFFKDTSSDRDALKSSRIMIIVAWITLLLTALIYFSSDLITTSSIAIGAVILLFTALSCRIVISKAWIQIILFSVNSIYFFLVWVVILPGENLNINWSMIFIHIISIISLILIPLHFRKFET